VTSRLSEGWVCNGRRYEDEAESSETLERPGLLRLLERIREGKVDRVVVHRLDRLSRRLVDCIGFLRELHDRQIPSTIVTQPELGTSAEHSFFLYLRAKKRGHEEKRRKGVRSLFGTR
jgi:DNA invertase Pin-like site-specific DNA recombinase